MNTIFLLTLTYQCQMYALTKSQQRKIATSEIEVPSIRQRHTWSAKRRREIVEVMPIHKYIEYQRMKCFGHPVTKMTRHRPTSIPRLQYVGGKSGWPDSCWIADLVETRKSYSQSRHRSYPPSHRPPSSPPHGTLLYTWWIKERCIPLATQTTILFVYFYPLHFPRLFHIQPGSALANKMSRDRESFWLLWSGSQC